MRAHARAPYAFAPALLPATAGKHAKPGELPAEQAFDYRQPFKVDLGRAAVIAEGAGSADTRIAPPRW
jgi:hypothetical protein